VRIPFPVHIPLSRVAGFAAVLFLVQIFQGTSTVFALCSFLFIVLTGITFNLAGGLSRPSGSYVFSYAVLAVILGLVWKAILGERADSNLNLPDLTMEIYVATMLALCMAVLVSRKLTLRRPLLGKFVTDANMLNASVGCTATGVVIAIALQVAKMEQGSAFSALFQINRFLPMGLILGVIHEVRSSGGKRSMNLPALIAAGVLFCQGLLGFSKEGIFTPLACWVVAAGSQGYRISRYQLIAILFGAYYMVHFLVPYAQYGRNYFQPTFIESARMSADLLGDPQGTRQKYMESNEDYYSRQIQGYYNTSQGFMDRLQMISPDDRLHQVTEEQGPIGAIPIIMGFENLIPRVLWPGKPFINFGNFYAHQMGGLSEDDTTTGISFSPAGESFHIDRWFGIFFWGLLLWIMLFTVFDSLCGDARVTPWGLVMCAYFAHVAPEGGLQMVIYTMGYILFGLVVAAFSAAYVMPILGILFKGSQKAEVRRIPIVAGMSRRNRPLPQQGISE